jgi:hypothetical protein
MSQDSGGKVVIQFVTDEKVSNPSKTTSSYVNKKTFNFFGGEGGGRGSERYIHVFG